jgi:hypothetical protein
VIVLEWLWALWAARTRVRRATAVVT